MGMEPKEQPLRIADGPGRVREVAMGWTASHQNGWTLYVGDVPQTFRAHSLFDALALYRETIEPDGLRLLHAAGRADCWADPRTDGQRVQRLTPGVEQTEAIECFAPAQWEEVTDLATQRRNFDAWMKSLAPVPVGRVRPRAGHERDPPGVEFSGLARMAGEYLVNGKPNLERVLGRRRQS
jgi:hypothetical protein